MTHARHGRDPGRRQEHAHGRRDQGAARAGRAPHRRARAGRRAPGRGRCAHRDQHARALRLPRRPHGGRHLSRPRLPGRHLLWPERRRRRRRVHGRVRHAVPASGRRAPGHRSRRAGRRRHPARGRAARDAARALREGLPAAHRDASEGRPAQDRGILRGRACGRGGRGGGGAPPRAGRRVHERQHAGRAGAGARARRAARLRRPMALHPVVVVHYHEISLKRGNRPLFLRHLARNLERATGDLGPVTLRQRPGRIVLDLDDNPQPEAVLERARRVCGVASVSLGYRTSSTLQAMQSLIGRLVEGRTFGSFRISARRAFKTYPMSSVELNRALGAFVLERVPTRVSLEHPEVDIVVEVLPDETFVSLDRRPGPGGLPVGGSGTVAALISGGIDSPVAAWRMMKRGCREIFVHFHSVPYLPDTSQVKVRALVERLTEWQYASRLHLVPFGEIQREVVLSVPPPARVVVYRRLMLRIAEVIARGTGALALATGESLGQVASQTLENIAAIDAVATRPVLRPLVGTDKIEITDEAKRLGTFETSIEPDADCCTLFVPKHPATRMTPDEAAAVESRLELERLVQAGVDGAVMETFAFPGAESRTVH